MEFWQSGPVLDGLLIATLLFGAGLLRLTGPVRRLGVPGSIIAGCLGLILGQGALGVLPLDKSALESLVYHGLGIVFIAVSLQQPAKGTKGGGATSFALAVPVLLCIQGIVGLGFVMVVSLFAAESMHPGFGLLVPLGFEQGPGQALSLGKAWEETGLQNGAQLGLIMATLGFGWAIVAGVPLAAWGRRKGLVQPARDSVTTELSTTEALAEPGALDRLSTQLVAIGIIYLITYGIVYAVAEVAFADKPLLAHTAWGFHFIVGAVVALLVRVGLTRLPVVSSPLDDRLLGRISGVTVDFVTCGAIAAIQIEVLQANWLPLFVVSALGGAVTLLAVVWISARAFPDHPFEHCVLLFGTATGTLPMGLALLRTIDPHLRTPASINAAVGSAGAVPFAAVFLMVVLPYAISGWPAAYPATGWITLAMMAAGIVAIVVGWRLLGPLRFHGEMTQLWPQQDGEGDV